MSEASAPKTRLWNVNFLLLWQGQLVSAIGDVVYELALGFWIFAMTGSSGLMGGLMAASVIPRVIVGPFAGVIVDRSDRKWLLVLMDAVRGVVVLGVALAALFGVAQIWMVFAAGVIIGLCASFFNPSISSVLPDIVKRDQVVQANSFFSMIHGASGILGSSFGGVIYAAIGAPLMFLVNGISYLFSSVTELFIKVPAKHKEREPSHFMTDLKQGLRFVWQTTGLRFLVLTAGVINFLASAGMVLMIPFFESTSWLGPARYGVTMAVMTASMLAGMAVMAAVKVEAEQRLTVFGIGMVVFIAGAAVFPLFNVFWPMLIAVALFGFANAVVNILIQSVMQLGVPGDMRGKVFGLTGTITQGLTPIGLALGGLLGEVLPYRLVICGCFVLVAIYFFPQLGSRSIRDFFAIEDAEAATKAESGPVAVESTDGEDTPPTTR
jgi:MFS transporter, DHA3 family, macrolide efflux protein